MVLISSGVDVFLSAEKLNSSSEDQETDNTPITTPLNIGVAGGPAGLALAGPLLAQETNFARAMRAPFSNSRTTAPRAPMPLLNELLPVHPPTTLYTTLVWDSLTLTTSHTNPTEVSGRRGLAKKLTAPTVLNVLL